MSINLGTLYNKQQKDKEKAFAEYQEKIKQQTTKVLKDLEDAGFKVGEVIDVCNAVQQTLQMQYMKKELVELVQVTAL